VRFVAVQEVGVQTAYVTSQLLACGEAVLHIDSKERLILNVNVLLYGMHHLQVLHMD
jgi:hypothetical protein